MIRTTPPSELTMQDSRDFGIRRGVSASFMPLGNIDGQEYQREYHQRRRQRQRQGAMRRARSLSPAPAPGAPLQNRSLTPTMFNFFNVIQPPPPQDVGLLIQVQMYSTLFARV